MSLRRYLTVLAQYLSMWKKGVFYCFFEIHSIKGELDERFVKERAEVVLLGAKPFHLLVPLWIGYK